MWPSLALLVDEEIHVQQFFFAHFFFFCFCFFVLFSLAEVPLLTKGNEHIHPSRTIYNVMGHRLYFSCQNTRCTVSSVSLLSTLHHLQIAFCDTAFFCWSTVIFESHIQLKQLEIRHLNVAECHERLPQCGEINFVLIQATLLSI